MSTYFLASEKALHTGFIFDDVSKPLERYKTGEDDDLLFVVIIPEFRHYDHHFNQLTEEQQIDVWVREINSGFFNVEDISLKNIKSIGFGAEVENVLDLTTERNMALTISELTRYHGFANPLEFVNSL